MSDSNEINLNEHVFPMEFISMKTPRDDFPDTIILTTIEYLLSLNWPTTPKPPPLIDVGTCIENFIRNIINRNENKNKKEINNTSDKCKIDNNLDKLSNNQNIDYNQLLQVLQTMLNKTK